MWSCEAGVDSQDRDPPLYCGVGVGERLRVGAAFPGAFRGTGDMAARELSCLICPTSYWLLWKHSIFRIWGSLEQGWGGLGQRLLLLQQRGQNSRKEEGPDEPLSCLYWAAERGACGRFSAAMGTAASIRPSQPEPCAGSCTPAFPSLEKWPQSLGWVLEARAVLASILPSHQGQLCSVYLWWLLSKSQACSPQIHLKTRGSSRWVGEKWVKSKM